jgi:hypothetical protein
MASNEAAQRSRPADRPDARARSARESVRREAQGLTAQAAERAAEVSRRLREQGERLLAEQKLRAAGGLQDIGSSIREAAGRLANGPLEPVGSYVETAAERVSRASEYLAEREVAEVFRDAEAAVLRRPQWFLGGMFVAGLVLARFLKASAPAAEGRTAGSRHERERETATSRQEPPRAGRRETSKRN